MTVIEAIMRAIQSPSLREQVRVARYVQRLSETARRKRATILRQTHGSLDEADARAFEEALAESRKIEAQWRASSSKAQRMGLPSESWCPASFYPLLQFVL